LMLKSSRKCGNGNNSASMSKIGKQPVALPQGVQVTLTNGMLNVVGPKGTLQRVFPTTLTLEMHDNEAVVKPTADDELTRALFGTYRSHLNNMVIGVTKGYQKKLLIIGIGFRAAVKADTLELELGFSHPVHIKIPEGIKVETTKEDMTISGIDKELVGLFTAKVRALKKPEPYKGKGLRYDDEHVIRKQGKKTAE